MNEILDARHKLFEEQRVNDAHAKLTGSQSVNDEASFKPDKSVSPPPQQHTNQTLESLIQLEILKTVKSSFSTSQSQSPPSVPPNGQQVLCSLSSQSSQPPPQPPPTPVELTSSPHLSYF